MQLDSNQCLPSCALPSCAPHLEVRPGEAMRHLLTQAPSCSPTPRSMCHSVTPVPDAARVMLVAYHIPASRHRTTEPHTARALDTQTHVPDVLGRQQAVGTHGAALRQTHGILTLHHVLLTASLLASSLSPSMLPPLCRGLFGFVGAGGLQWVQPCPWVAVVHWPVR